MLPCVYMIQRLFVMQDIMFVDTQHYTFYSWQALEHHARLLTDQVLGVPAAYTAPIYPSKYPTGMLVYASCCVGHAV